MCRYVLVYYSIHPHIIAFMFLKIMMSVKLESTLAPSFVTTFPDHMSVYVILDMNYLTIPTLVEVRK